MILVTIVFLQVSVFLTTIYLHRALTHRGMKIHPVVATLMHLHLTLFTGIDPREWVAVHRKHHHFSDKEGDPHSPYLLGLWHVFLGNAYYYRREAKNPATVHRYTRDYEGTVIDKLPIGGFGALGGLVLFTLAFGWIWGGWIWGSVLFISQGAAYILLNSSINSFCHMTGYRNFRNKATNLRWVALITGGEGLHNNHHQYPSSARLSMKPGEIDPAWAAIRLLVVLGLAELSEASVAKAA
ncbi:MAG: hypothetical protein GY953_19170 [bacterium]|nr:hypothetical protein [bacterium]